MYQNKYKTLVNFKTNLNQPRHSWFDVKEGYSTVLVNNILSDLKINKNLTISIIVFENLNHQYEG